MDRVNFYTKQLVTPGEMNTFKGDVENALNWLSSKGVGQGLIWGGDVTPHDVDPLAVDISPFFSHSSPNGEVLKSDQTIMINMTHVGQTAVGQGGSADGSEISVPSGHRMWIGLAMVPERLKDDLRATSPVTYWREFESFKFVLAAGPSVASPSFPDRPALPTSYASFIYLADILLYNDGATTEVEMVDNSRRTRWVGGRPNMLDIGSPAILSEFLVKAQPWTPGDAIDVNEFFGPLSAVQPEFQGQILHTVKGGLVIQRSKPVLHQGIMLTIPIINLSNANIVRTLKVQAIENNLGAGNDFLEFSWSTLGAPYSVTNGGWSNSDSAYNMFNSDGTKQTFSDPITLVPGRNILRLYWRHVAGDALTAAVTSQLLDHADLVVDRDMLNGLLHNHDFQILLGDIA